MSYDTPTRCNMRLKVTGCSFKDRQTLLQKTVCHNITNGWLEREPNCPFDRNAIRVMTRIDGQPACIGYIDRETAKTLGPFMDTGRTIYCDRLTIIGGTPHKPTYGCMIDISFFA